jgi:glyoxylase-like metal-dependent hydrolase (beta-lactamase superfamily II)
MPFLRPESSFAVAEGVHGFRSVMVNFFIVRPSAQTSEWVLVDAGLRSSGPRIAKEAERLAKTTQAPLAIILTHGHFDHVGALPWLTRHWKVPVYAHRDELPYINERKPYPPPDPSVGGGLMARSSPLFPRRGPLLSGPVYALRGDGSVPGLPEWRWLATPGHSPGHVSLWRQRDRTLLAGDAIINTRQESALAVFRQSQEVRPPPAYFTPNWRVAYDSMRTLQSLAPEVVAGGHGLPARGDSLKQQLADLLNDFPEKGLPRRGHYVRQTWQEAAR